MTMTAEQINQSHRAALDHAESLLPGRWRTRLRIEQRFALPDVRFHWLDDSGESVSASPWYVDVDEFQQHIETVGAIIDGALSTGYYRSEVVA